ncbi:MAG: hypothetical protein V3T86_10680 [Planctomycetota bacterium]
MSKIKRNGRKNKVKVDDTTLVQRAGKAGPELGLLCAAPAIAVMLSAAFSDPDEQSGFPIVFWITMGIVFFLLIWKGSALARLLWAGGFVFVAFVWIFMWQNARNPSSNLGFVAMCIAAICLGLAVRTIISPNLGALEVIRKRAKAGDRSLDNRLRGGARQRARRR